MKIIVLIAATALLLAACGAPTPTPMATLAPGTPSPTSTATLPPLKATTSPTPTQPPTRTGTLEVRVTDQPIRDVTKVLVTAKSIRVHKEGSPDESGWKTVVDREVSFDLLKVSGIEELLGKADLEAGRYTQARLEVVKVEVTLRGKAVAAEVPSGEIRIVRLLTIEPGQTTIATLDFDAERSVNLTGGDRVIFRPVVALLVRKSGEPFRPAATTTPVTTLTPAPTTTPVTTPSPTPTVTPTAKSAVEVQLFLEITSPQQTESVVAQPTITISGLTRPDAVVTINDDFAEPDAGGAFQKLVKLEAGPNVIEIVASVATGEQVSKVLVVIYSP